MVGEYGEPLIWLQAPFKSLQVLILPPTQFFQHFLNGISFGIGRQTGLLYVCFEKSSQSPLKL